MKKDHGIHAQLKCTGIFAAIVAPVFACAVFLHAHKTAFFLFNFLAGILAWTYIEYFLHRFWTHNNHAVSSKGAFKRHVHHHQHPTEIKVTARQRWILFLLSAVMFFFACWWNNYFTIFAAATIGLAYSFFSHWLLHQSWAHHFFPLLQKFHIHHHYKYPDRCFGFTTVFWDIIFGTVPPKHAVISEKVMRFYHGTGKQEFLQ